MRRPLAASAAMLRLHGACTAMAWQAAIVVPLRMQRIAFAAPGCSPEATRMVTEKLAALATGAGAATVRALRGGDAVSVAIAAIGPARRTVRANARRLAKG